MPDWEDEWEGQAEIHVRSDERTGQYTVKVSKSLATVLFALKKPTDLPGPEWVLATKDGVESYYRSYRRGDTDNWAAASNSCPDT